MGRSLIGKQKRAGSLTPLSFLKSDDSLGIGNFKCLELYIELANKRGESIVQILPLNDTGANHLCPYSALSSFAINPVYISCSGLYQTYKDRLSLQVKAKHKELVSKAKTIENAKAIDYPAIRKNIIAILRNIFNEIEKEVHPLIQKFRTAHPWVLDYALFNLISEQNNHAAWYNWQELDLRNHRKHSLNKFTAKHKAELNFYIFCQVIALEQLKNVRKLALTKNIFIKGDIPILVDRNSADVWANPDLFHLDYGAGAPPDMFTIGGQEWGNPPLIIEKPEAVNYFISRFQFGHQYMDMVRIDHVLGLFRLMIWNNTLGNITNQGFFYPQTNTEKNTCITRSELTNIGINPDVFTKITGVITEISSLGNVAKICVKLGLAKWIEGKAQIAWNNNLNHNEDNIKKLLSENRVNENDIWKVITARRRLQNCLGYYFGGQNNFFFTYYGRDTWHYLNLSDHQKHLLNELLWHKERQHFELWRELGSNMLQKLSNKTHLVLCAEDLGHVDPYIPEVLAELKIPGINIIRWSPSFKKDVQRHLAVITTATHDTSSFREWWNNEIDSDTKKRFLGEFLGKESDNIPQKIPTENIRQIFLELFDTPAIFVIHPFWEILNVFYQESDKRINLPGHCNPTNWCPRMEKTLEFYLKDEKISTIFKKAIEKSKRV
ncbi:4-alpha-glucanotransferase [Candidatus Margulisiibacteriota bacterium]